MQALEKDCLNLVNVLLSIGLKPTIELAQLVQEKGRLGIMHKLLFPTLAFLPEEQRDSRIVTLSGLFK